jgi:hypothetical protein
MINKNGKKMDGGLNGPIYIEQVLKELLKEFFNAVKNDEGLRILIMKDGAPSHCSKFMKQV